jgi:hypothetical protein
MAHPLEHGLSVAQKRSTRTQSIEEMWKRPQDFGQSDKAVSILALNTSEYK